MGTNVNGYRVQRFKCNKGTNVKGIYRVYLEYTLADSVKSRRRIRV